MRLYFDGHPILFLEERRYINSDRSIIPYNGMQLMELIVKFRMQEGLEIQGITPSAASQYPEILLKLKRTIKIKNGHIAFIFIKTEHKEIYYQLLVLNRENKITSTSFTVDGLVSIKDIAMRRHLIEYGEFSVPLSRRSICNSSILAKEPSVGFFTFGLDGDDGTTAEYTTSLDGLQYTEYRTYFYDCKKACRGETIKISLQKVIILT